MGIRLIATGFALLSLVETCRANSCSEHPVLEPPLPRQQFKIVSAFGLRRSPFSGRLAFHAGVDLTGPARAAVFNMLDGRVAGLEPEAGGAFTITVRHCGGWVSQYRHVVDPVVAVGHVARRGERLASTARPDESDRSVHIHVALALNGRPVDPVRLFAGTLR